MESIKRCSICSGLMIDDSKRFGVIVCRKCGHKEYGRLNSVVEPSKEKRGVVASAWDRITKL